jgi:hypothetical protein
VPGDPLPYAQKPPFRVVIQALVISPETAVQWAFGDFANDGFGSLSNTFIFFVSPPELMRIWHPFSAAYSSGDQTKEVTPSTFNKISDFQNIIELF